MAATRRKKTARRSGASRGRRNSSPPHIWFLAGLLLGLSVSGFLFLRGYLPERPEQQTEAVTPSQPEAEAELIDSPQGIAAGEKRSRYDFFTVLPEMEVVVPDQELTRGDPSGPALDSVPGNYILQAGSFRSAADAEALKARLALQGIVANVQLVTVNDETWHRVRIGPVEGARRADEIRRSLHDAGIETLVLKDSS